MFNWCCISLLHTRAFITGCQEGKHIKQEGKHHSYSISKQLLEDADNPFPGKLARCSLFILKQKVSNK